VEPSKEAIAPASGQAAHKYRNSLGKVKSQRRSERQFPDISNSQILNFKDDE